MSFASLGSAILRNNRRLRLRKKNLFEKDNDGDLDRKTKTSQVEKKKLSKSQIKAMKYYVAEILEQEKKKRISALLFTLIITLVIILLIVVFADPIFEAIRTQYNDYLKPKDW